MQDVYKELEAEREITLTVGPADESGLDESAGDLAKLQRQDSADTCNFVADSIEGDQVPKDSESAALQSGVSGNVGQLNAGSASLSNDELVSIAMNPHSVEAEWISACTLLNERSPIKRKSSQKRRTRLIALISVLAIFACSSSIFLVQVWHPWSGSSGAEPHFSSWVQEHSHWQNEEIRERETVHLAKLLHQLDWSATKAADYFGVPVSSMEVLLYAKKKHSFSIDELNRMLFALGEVPNFPEKPSEQEKLDAVEHYSLALKASPKNQYAYWRRGNAYRKLENYDLAIRDITRALEIYPNRPWLIEKRVWTYMEAKKFDLALNDANLLVKQFPDYNGEAIRAEVWSALKKYDLALIDNNVSIAKMRIASPEPYCNRAEIYEMLGMYKEAICDLEKALEIDPNHSNAREQIARLKKTSAT